MFQSIGFVLLVPEFELSLCSQADRTDHRVLTEFLLVITVPGHPVLAVAVIINQNGIECHSSKWFNRLLDREQFRGPRFWNHINTGVGVGLSWISIPRFQSGNEALFAVEADLVLGPFNFFFQIDEQAVGGFVVKKLGMILKVGIGKIELFDFLRKEGLQVHGWWGSRKRKRVLGFRMDRLSV